MGGGFQRNASYRGSDRDGSTSCVQSLQHSCLLLKERQRRSHALTIFGSLVRQRFVNSALFTLAGSFLKRMKQYFQTGWQQQQYVPRTRPSSENSSAPTRATDEGMVGRATTNKYPYRSPTSNCDVPQELVALDVNGNANTRKRPDQRRPRGRPRKHTGEAAEKSKQKQHHKPKCGNSRRSGAKCQRSKKISSRLKKNAASEAYNKVVQSTLTEMVDHPSVGTHAESTTEHIECQTHHMKFAQYANGAGLSAAENIFGVSLSENVPLFVTGINNGTKRQRKRKRRTGLKSKTLTNVTEANQRKNAHTTRPETKSLSLPQMSKSARQSERSVTLSRPNVCQSNPGFIANQDNNNDWPSLAELGRRKGLSIEAATKVVKRKYTGAGVRDAGIMLTDVINVESRSSEENMEETESRSWAVQHQCASNSNQRTWASVAAQSSTRSVRRASKHRPSENHQTSTQQSVESTPVGHSLSLVSLLRIRKPPMRSKLAYSIRLAGDHSKIKEKPTLGKFMTEHQENTKFIKTIRCKNKIARHFCQKDNPVVLGAVQEKRKPRKGEMFDKMHDNGGHMPSTYKLKSYWKQNWKVDEMPTVYACTTPPVIVLSEQVVSEPGSKREPPLEATQRLDNTTDVAVAADNTDGHMDVSASVPTNTSLLPVASPGVPSSTNLLPVASPGVPISTNLLPFASPGVPTNTSLLSYASPGVSSSTSLLPVASPGVPISTRLLLDNVFSNIRDDERDVALAASCFEIKAESLAPLETEIPAAVQTEIPDADVTEILAGEEIVMPALFQTEIQSPGEIETPTPTETEIIAPVEPETRSPKKISVRYRALLRGDCSHMDAKTLTEMQTRNKKTNHLHDSKVATRERQRQKRQERQTIHHDAVRFHTFTCADEHSQGYESVFANNRCPYWLRSMQARECIKEDPLADTQSEEDKVHEAGSLDVTCTASINFAQRTPSRHSERLRAKPKNRVWSSYLQ